MLDELGDLERALRNGTVFDRLRPGIVPALADRRQILDSARRKPRHGRRADVPVCHICGSSVQDEPACPNCGKDLRAYDKLPLRSDWERDQEIDMSEPGDDDASERFELNPVALAATLLGAGMTVLGLFLPANENPGFAQVDKNTLIQQGVVVWSVVIFGAVFVIDLARSYQRKKRPNWGELLFPITVGTSTARLLGGTTLYPIVNGSPDSGASGVHAAAGTGVYVVLAGAVISALGIIAMRAWPGRELQHCPECAETILSEARVCRHCGYRLERANAS